MAGPLPPEVSLSEVSKGNVPALMIAGGFVRMLRIEDGWFRSDQTRRADGMLTTYWVYERGVFDLDWNRNIILHGGFLQRGCGTDSA